MAFVRLRSWPQPAHGRRSLSCAKASPFTTVGPFVRSFDAEDPPSPSSSAPAGGSLRGISLGVKDLFALAGHATGFGSPAYRRAFPEPARTDSDCVALLKAQGARVVGVLHQDECAYSLQGENQHYGTPTNGRAPRRIPGGSSSGCGSAVSLGEVDLALGSDTAGSVRVPASFCGVYGMRPTHGRVSLRGAVPLAGSFDTPGVLADDIDTFVAGMRALLGAPGPGEGAAPLRGWKVARDAFGLADEGVAAAIYAAVSGRKDAWARALGSDPVEISIGGDAGGPAAGGLEGWIDVFRIVQAREVWLAHGPWITEHGAMGQFGAGVRERFEMASGISDEDFARASSTREAIRAHVDGLFRAVGGEEEEGGTASCSAIVLPTTPTIAPLLATPAEELDGLRRRTISLCSVASLCGLPQISLPLAAVPVEGEGEVPVGVSLLGPRGSDEALLAAAAAIARAYAP